MDLPALWRLHQNAPFPSSCLALSIDGVKLVKLDADVGASLTASLRTDGVPRLLPPGRRASLTRVLELVRKTLQQISLTPDALEYFKRLETFALAVLAVKE